MKLPTIVAAVMTLLLAQGIAVASSGYHLVLDSVHFQIQDGDTQTIARVAAVRGNGRHIRRHSVTIRFDEVLAGDTNHLILNAEKTIGALEHEPATKVIRICLITLTPKGQIRVDRSFNDEVVRECAKHRKRVYGGYMTVCSIHGRIVNILSDEYGVAANRVSVRVDRAGRLHLVRYQ